jgi:hypothetical protein
MSTLYLVTPREQPNSEAYAFESRQEARGFIAESGETFDVYALAPMGAIPANEQDECAAGWYDPRDDA